MSDPTKPVAFYIERLRTDGGYFRAVLVNAHGSVVHRSTLDACADQAASQVTRQGKRPLAYLGMRGMHGGEWQSIPDDMRCPVGRHDWQWPNHGFTHGTIARIQRNQAPLDTLAVPVRDSLP